MLSKKIRFSCFIILIVCLFACKNTEGNKSAKEETNKNVVLPPKDNRTELHKLFDSFYKNNTYYFDLIKHPEIRRLIIDQYSEAYYDKVVEVSQVCVPVEYDSNEGIYSCWGGVQHLVTSTYSNISYDPKYDSVNVDIYIDNEKLDSSGRRKTGKWEKGYYKDDFGEPDPNLPYIEVDIEGKDRIDDDVYLNIRFNANEGLKLFMSGFANDFRHGVKFLIRDNESKEVYTVPVERIVNGSIIITNIETFKALASILNNGYFTISFTDEDSFGMTRRFLFDVTNQTCYFTNAMAELLYVGIK